VAKLNTESKNAAATIEQWKEKETKWLKEKKDLEAEAERLREQLKNKKQSAAEELSNNADEGNRIDPKNDAGSAAAAVNESPKSGAGVLPAPVVVEKNADPAAAAVPVIKAKDEIGVQPETQ
jgi:peptidoglycan hydrolase CwlO-like protein